VPDAERGRSGACKFFPSRLCSLGGAAGNAGILGTGCGRVAEACVVASDLQRLRLIGWVRFGGFLDVPCGHLLAAEECGMWARVGASVAHVTGAKRRELDNFDGTHGGGGWWLVTSGMAGRIGGFRSSGKAPKPARQIARATRRDHAVPLCQ
jgi:hypothetical protein